MIRIQGVEDSRIQVEYLNKRVQGVKDSRIRVEYLNNRIKGPRIQEDVLEQKLKDLNWRGLIGKNSSI